MRLVKNPLQQTKRLVLKVGSSLLIKRGGVNMAWLEALADDLMALNVEIIIVTSGAVGLGRGRLKAPKNLSIPQKQAASSVGQIALMNAWESAFMRHRQPVAQLLLTLQDTEERKRHLNAQATIDVLLENHITPIINENDAIATAELRYGDNDRLAARVAQLSNADTLVLLTDIDGLYTSNPAVNDDAKHIPVVHELKQETMNMAGDAGSDVGTGGMKTKLLAAQLANAAGFNMVIASGQEMHAVKSLVDGGIHTFFPASRTPLSARKQWLAAMVKPSGDIYVDAGAERALAKGASLLPIGVTGVTGTFDRGDPVRIISKDGLMLAQGLSRYNSTDVIKIKGQHTNSIEEIIGYYYGDALVHRDDMA